MSDTFLMCYNVFCKPNELKKREPTCLFLLWAALTEKKIYICNAFAAACLYLP